MNWESKGEKETEKENEKKGGGTGVRDEEGRCVCVCEIETSILFDLILNDYLLRAEDLKYKKLFSHVNSNLNEQRNLQNPNNLKNTNNAGTAKGCKQRAR